MKLIDNWPALWRAHSMRALALLAILQTTLAALPASALETPVPGLGFTWGSVLVACSVAVAFLGAAGRAVDQGGVSK